uniref:Zinc finger CCHC domain-containing protein 7 n=1 Tax=Oryzias melastigma TaxID=30732 RepID=A0A3B3BRT8_ORYME
MSQSRYFTEKTFYCGNCSMMGHLSRSCPDSVSPHECPGACRFLCNKLKPCFICGALGHLGDKCPNNYCSNCYQPGHTSKTCSEIPCGKKQCQRCGMKGHFSDVSASVELFRGPAGGGQCTVKYTSLCKVIEGDLYNKHIVSKP